MIKLSEEILKMSEHEAKEALTDNLYKSKYYIYDNWFYGIGLYSRSYRGKRKW